MELVIFVVKLDAIAVESGVNTTWTTLSDLLKIQNNTKELSKPKSLNFYII